MQILLHLEFDFKEFSHACIDHNLVLEIHQVSCHFISFDHALEGWSSKQFMHAMFWKFQVLFCTIGKTFGLDFEKWIAIHHILWVSQCFTRFRPKKMCFEALKLSFGLELAIWKFQNLHPPHERWSLRSSREFELLIFILFFLQSLGVGSSSRTALKWPSLHLYLHSSEEV